MGSVPDLGRSPEVGNPLQYSRLENSRDRGALWATVHGHDLVTNTHTDIPL